MKVVILGLDGCTWKLLTPFIQTGLLPNLKFIVENGVSTKLVSTIPPSTSPAWPSMITGLNPGKLGVFSALARGGKDDFFLKNITSDIYKGKAVWDILSDKGFRVALFKIPFLYPVYKVKGYMVSGFGSASKFAAYPDYLHEKLIAGPSRLLEEELFKELETLDPNDKRHCLGFIKQISRLFQDESKVVLELIDSQRWDFCFYVISSTDWLQHAFMDKLMALTRKLKNAEDLDLVDEALADFYKRIDAFIGCISAMLEKIEDDYIFFLVSDHGFTIRPQTFNIANWLIQKGYMKLESKNHVVSDVVHAQKMRLLRLTEKIASLAIVEPFLRMLPASLLSLLARIYYRAATSSLGSISRSIDFDSSEVFCLEDRALYVSPSVDPKAVLSRLTEELEKSIKQFRRAKLRAFRKNEIYWGDRTELAPDLIIEIIEDGNIWELSANPSKPLVFTPPLPGKHDRNGIFAAYGPPIRRGTWMKNKAIWDIASTILHVFDLAIPTSMDGEPLTEIYEEKSKLARRPVKHQATDLMKRTRGVISSQRRYLTRKTHARKHVI